MKGVLGTVTFDRFSFGAASQGVTFGIPLFNTTNDWTGYLADRRPASAGDAYLIVDRIMRTVKVAHEEALKAV